jgi:hypothetical protein
MGDPRKSRTRKKQPIVELLEPRSYLSVTFSGPTFYTNIRGVTGIAVGDLNGQGKPDVVVAGLAPNTATGVVAVYPNQSGSFGTPTIYPLPSATGGVAIGDFEGSGKQDIAATDPSDNQLFILKNDGSGNFSPGAGASLGGSTGDVVIVAADFNGDGKADVAVADPTDNQVVIAFSNGDGSFSTQAPVSVPDPQKVVAADFNGDGHTDLAILSGQSPNSLYIAMNNGTGTFAAPVAYSFGPDFGTISDIASADFNGDGSPDLVGVGSGSAGGGVAAVLLNQGTGLFTSVNDLPLPAAANAVVTGNFSGSGHGDIAALGSGGSLDILPGNGDGTFGSDQTVFTVELATPGGQALSADFDANGQPDIAYLSRSQGGFGILLNSSGSNVPGGPSVIAPSLSGKLTTRELVAGGKITAVTQTITFTASTAFTGSVTVNFQFSLTNTINSNNPAVATVTRKLNLKAGRSLRAAVSIRSLPAGLSGAYYLVGQLTDSNGAVATAASAQTVGIVPPTIDLAGGVAALRSTAKAGGKTNVTLGVTNYGSIAANGSLPVEIFASTSGAIDASAILVDQFTQRVAIPAGKSRRLPVTIPLPTEAGNYYLIVVLDPQNTLNDVNLSNNTFVSGTTIALS